LDFYKNNNLFIH